MLVATPAKRQVPQPITVTYDVPSQTEADGTLFNIAASGGVGKSFQNPTTSVLVLTLS
jgi:hypothetical protein